MYFTFRPWRAPWGRALVRFIRHHSLPPQPWYLHPGATGGLYHGPLTAASLAKPSPLVLEARAFRVAPAWQQAGCSMSWGSDVALLKLGISQCGLLSTGFRVAMLEVG